MNKGLGMGNQSPFSRTVQSSELILLSASFAIKNSATVLSTLLIDDSDNSCDSGRGGSDANRSMIKDMINDRLKDRLSENQDRILATIAANPHVTASELAMAAGINERNIRSSIKILQDAGLLKRVGARKNGYWKVVK